MPTYQYACTHCAERTEVVQKFTDEPLLVCGTCGGRLRKVFSPVGIVFKGSGFYRTDSRAGAKKDKVLNGSSENGLGLGWLVGFREFLGRQVRWRVVRGQESGQAAAGGVGPRGVRLTASRRLRSSLGLGSPPSGSSHPASRRPRRRARR